MKRIFFVLLIISNCISIFGQNIKKNKEGLSYYQWYGKRFDWILDLYSRNPLHRDSIHLFIREVGEGKDTFLVLHGGFGSEHSYLLDPLLPLADKAHFIFYDQRGSLRSSCPDSLISVNDHINDMERIRKAFRMERINIIAHSMGTWLASAYLEKYPDRTGKMILISGLLIKNDEKKISELSRKYTDSVFNAIWSEQPKRWPGVLQRFGLDTNSKRSEWNKLSRSAFMYMQQFWAASGMISDYDNWEKANHGSTFLYKQNAANPAAQSMSQYWDFTNVYRNHKFPITIIKAEGDYLSPGLLKENIENIPNVTFVLIKNAGHNIWLEQSSEFNKEMRKALKR